MRTTKQIVPVCNTLELNAIHMRCHIAQGISEVANANLGSRLPHSAGDVAGSFAADF